MTTLFIGLGRMGAPMVRHYSRHFPVVLYDAGPAAAELAAELSVPYLETLGAPADVDTVILMLPNSRIVESVLETSGLLAALPQGALVIDMGSSVPSSTRRLAAAAAERGIGYVDAPVSGGVAKATDGTLSIIVAGDDADVARALPHLDPMAGVITEVGPPGAAHAAKAINNLVSATNIATAAEALSIAGAFGIEPSVMVDVLNASTGRSQASEVKFPQHILTGLWNSGFAMDLMVKDLGIARDLARELEVTSPVTAAAFEMAREAVDDLDPTPTDHTELARYYEHLNHLDFARGVDKDRESRS